MNRRDDAFFEKVARAKKVAKLLALVPPSTSVEADTRMAAIMATWSQGQRHRWADAANVKAPSVETWGDLLAALISRNAQPRNPEVSRDHWNDEWSA